MDDLAAVCGRVASYNSRLKKVGILAEYFRGLPDADLIRAVRFLSAGPLATEAGKKFSVGYAAMRQAVLAASGYDDFILGVCYREVGDGGEAIGLILHGKTADCPMNLAEAEQLYARLYKSRNTAAKIELLTQIFKRYRPPALKFFIKIITGELRIGLQSKMVEEAVALATGTPLDVIKQANNRLGDLSRIAIAARAGNVHEIEARLFHPMDFMLAKPLEALTDLPDPENWWVEDKYDGIRSQVHFDHGRVMIFTRGMEEATNAFPEVVEALRQIPACAAVDGEILAWRGERAEAFAVLQQRIARKKVPVSMIEKIPVVFMGYDLLYHENRMLVDTPVEERRALMESLLGGRGPRLLLSPRYEANTHDDIDRYFAEARERGNEGLVLKRRGSFYEPGRRSGTWHKVKRPFATLDVVVTAAEQGHGRRATVLSDYTFAVRAADQYVNVGKAYSGLTDQEIRELTRIFRAHQTERFGRVTLVKPEIVLEVAFDGVQKSPRHKSGFALRFPRIVRWRKDKTVDEIDTIEHVRALYDSSLNNVRPVAPGTK